MTTRRGFLGAMLAACAAPAIVRADSLMRVIPRETEIILPPKPEPRPKAIWRMDDGLADGEHTVVRTLGAHALKAGDIISIAGVLGLGGGGQMFRIADVTSMSLTIAQHVEPQRREPAVPWFRQHEKRGRR